MAQITGDIYTGKVQKWSELGGPKQIVRVSRDTNSGTYETFETLVMNKEKSPETGIRGKQRRHPPAGP